MKKLSLKISLVNRIKVDSFNLRDFVTFTVGFHDNVTPWSPCHSHAPLNCGKCL